MSLGTLQGVQDCTTVSATFKLLEGFEGILERPLIAAELHVSHLRLLSAYAADLGAAIALFKANMARPMLPQNAAPYSGAIYWAHGLMDRVSGELSSLANQERNCQSCATSFLCL